MLAAACGGSTDHEGPPPQPPAAPQAPAAPASNERVTLPTIDPQPILQHIKTLSSDEFEGRAPGTKGEELTVEVPHRPVQEARACKPGNTDGTYIQKVPLVGITGDRGQAADVSRKGAQKRPSSGATRSSRGPSTSPTAPASRTRSSSSSATASTRRSSTGTTSRASTSRARRSSCSSTIRRCRTPPDPSKLDAEDVRRQGDDLLRPLDLQVRGSARARARPASLIVHETGPAGYPFAVVQGNLGEKFDLVTPDKNMGRASIEGWISLDAAKQLLKMAGQDFDALKKQAADARVQAGAARRSRRRSRSRNTMRTIESRNVAGEARGQRPGAEGRVRRLHRALGSPRRRRAGQRRQDLQRRARQRVGRRGGARDRARLHAGASRRRSARSCSCWSPPRSRACSARSTTPCTPLYPLAKTLANINIDGINQWGRTKDITVVGLGASDLDDYLRDAAAEQGRTLRPDPGAGEGLLLPLRSLQLREAGRAGALHRRRRRVRRQAGRVRQAEARRVHRAATTTSRPTR